ncbi:uncharacterized protein LOC129730255 [Wyeomyia smithii]|uniref:uncharacterized protein LOC129730255 n=1 Tax=Wyeomyia smithii TaxID=174621 RepID=UPI002467D213|nr:uncharacterized protein LOC129730255 [Wyeomyia smithii]XP_055545408.1 uncharacterized protein LOC129730255 [Wyeomyia smithii]
MAQRSFLVVPGEASETDEENDDCGEIVKIESGPDAPPPISISTAAVPPQRGSSQELVDESAFSTVDYQQMQFQQMINERCVSLLNEFIHTTTISVSRQLAETDNLLMKSQMVLQNTTAPARKISESTDQVASKLEDALSSNFIPNINIPYD